MTEEDTREQLGNLYRAMQVNVDKPVPSEVETELTIMEQLTSIERLPDGTHEFDSAAQKRYLEICLSGANAKLYGANFYREYLETTFIGNATLSELYATISLK